VVVIQKIIHRRTGVATMSMQMGSDDGGAFASVAGPAEDLEVLFGGSAAEGQGMRWSN